MRKIIWLVLAILVILIAWRLVTQIREKQAEANRPGRSPVAVPIEINSVIETTLHDIGSFGGSLNPRSGYTLAPKVSGRLNQLRVNIGDRVNKGQLVAVLDDDVFLQQLEQARAQLAVASAQVEHARLAYKAAETHWTATKSLFENDFTTRAVMDQTDADKAATKARYDITLAEVQRAEAVVRTAEIQLSYTQIRADWGGEGTRLVGERFVDEGDMLSVNTPILTLIDNSSVTARIDVIERDYSRIRIGQPVLVRTDAYPDKVFSGRLLRLAPMLQDASRQARAEIDIPNPEGLLKPGMFVRVQIEYARKTGVFAIPIAAVVQRNGKSGVFTVDEEALTVSFVPVKTGIREGELTELIEPVIDKKIVVLGQDQLQDGAKIQLPSPKGEGNSGKNRTGGRP